MEDRMKVTLSPKYQIVIPKDARKRLGLRPGVKLEIIPYDDRLVIIPVNRIRNMRGFLKGMDTKLERGEDRI
jgi:AbrB family looped-hinge helix DNA binding protein